MIYSKIDPKSKSYLLELKNMPSYMKGGIEAAFDDIGKLIQTKIRRNILNEKKTGRVYLIRLNGKLKRHRASSPNQTAANITGSYYKSIGYEKQGYNKLSVGSTSVIGKYLEEGTKKMEPRPGIKNAVYDSNKIVEEYINKRMSNKIKK